MGWLRTPGPEEKHRSHVSHLPCSGTRRPGWHLPPQASPADMKQEACWHGQPGGWAWETLSTAAGVSHPHLGAQSNRGSTDEVPGRGCLGQPPERCFSKQIPKNKERKFQQRNRHYPPLPKKENQMETVELKDKITQIKKSPDGFRNSVAEYGRAFSHLVPGAAEMIRSERQTENSREKMNGAPEVCGATSVAVES